MLCYSTNYHTLSWRVRVSDCGYNIYLKNNFVFRIFAGNTIYITIIGIDSKVAILPGC